MKLAKNVLELIGETPIVEIRRLNPNPKVKILAKLEFFNPGGSIKDRIALRMIEDAEKRGELHPGKIILEATSGNTGIGLAMVGAVKGYKVLLVMPESVSEERKRILKAFGAEILLTPSELGTDGAIEEAYRLAREEPDKYFLVDQFNNPSNPLAHYHGTAEEIIKQTGGQLDAVVIAIGTTGSLVGVGRRLKEYNPRIKVVAVEPVVGHRIQGLKNLTESYIPGVFDPEVMDEKINVSDEEAYQLARRLAREEGLLVGMSSGAALFGAIKVAERMDQGVILTIFPDSGERYLSTSLFIERPVLNLKLYDTLTRKLKALIPQIPGKITMYTCGPTVSDPLHLGVWRRLIVADVLKRYLKTQGLEVIHVINITDIDDRTVNKAIDLQKDLRELTSFYIEEFFKESQLLRIDPATHYPKASEHILNMIQLAESLTKKGFAYEKHHSLYFSIQRCKEYGKLSHIDPKNLKSDRTELDFYDKDNPMDFALFKRSTLKELKAGICYESPWGKVRPGWHIECATLALKYLGETIDIHTSSTELIFPHNENEIAIAEALTGKPFVRYWLHVEQILSEGKKMGWDQGNAVTLGELMRMGFTPSQVRFFLIRTHYRKPLQWSLKGLVEAKKAWFRLEDLIIQVLFSREGPTYEPLGEMVEDFKSRFLKALENDLNIPMAISHIFTFLKEIQQVLKRGISSGNRGMIVKALKEVDQILQIMDFPPEEQREEVLSILEARKEARKRKDFVTSDKLREELLKFGLEVMDTPEGQVLRKART
jgi:cysteinyl-tRNA synthetase